MRTGRNLGYASRFAAVLLAAAAAGAGLWTLPGRFRSADRAVALWKGTPADLRSLREAADGFKVPVGVYTLARRVIPPDATYATITGPHSSFSTPVSAGGFGVFGTLYLLPRWPTLPQDAQYVISYGGLLQKDTGLRFRRIWSFAPGIAIGEVAR